MIARVTNCFRNRKRDRDPLCSAGDVHTLANAVQNHTTWGKITSRRQPPPGVFEEWARKFKCSVATVRRMWEEGAI
jgi:hypothetical protein